MATLYVYASDAAATAAGKNAGEYYTSIQAAVNDANSGDTIEIAAGTYAGDVTLQKDVVTGGAKALTFVGAEGAEVVIQGKVQISGASAVWDVQTIFKNITFQQVNEGGEVKGGVEIGRGDSQGNNYTNKFEKCIFIGNGFDNNVISTTARSNATKNEYEGCRFVNTNMSLYSEHSFSNCNFENAVPNFQNEQKISFNGCNFKLTVTDDMKDEDELYLIRTKGSIVADKCTFEFDNPDNVVPTAENPQWSFIWGRNDYGQGNFEISNSSFTAGENTSDVDMFHTEVRDAEKDNGSFNVTDSVAKGNIDFAEAAKGVANVTIENENKEDGTKDIIITDKTGESLLVGSVDDQGQLTINAEKSQGENFAALAADYANKAADKDYPVYVLSENGSMTGYDTLAEAAAAASAGEKIVISGNVSGKAVFADGKNYTITGNGTVAWADGWFYVGRGANDAVDTTVTFENAVISSSTNSSAYGFHVSGEEKGAADKKTGTLNIIKSNVVVDYSINRGTLNVEGDGIADKVYGYGKNGVANLIVKNGFGNAGRPAKETPDGNDATATVNLKNGAYVQINNENGMGIGCASPGDLEGYAILNITDSKLEYTASSMTVTAHGSVNATNGTMVLMKGLTNNGTITVSGESTINGGIEDEVVKAATFSGDGWVYMKNAKLDSNTNITGANVRFTHGHDNVIAGATINLTANGGSGRFQVGGGYKMTDLENREDFDYDNGVTVTVKDGAKIGSIDSSASPYGAWVGSEYPGGFEKEQFMNNARYTLDIKESVVRLGYLHVSNDGIFKVSGAASDTSKEAVGLDYDLHLGTFNVNGQAAISGVTAKINNLNIASDYSISSGSDAPKLVIGDEKAVRTTVYFATTSHTYFRVHEYGVLEFKNTTASVTRDKDTSIAENATVSFVNSIFNADTTIKNAGTISVDAASFINARAISGVGTITIDATDFTGTKKVINLAGTSSLEGKVTVEGEGITAIYGEDGDVTITDASTDTLYVNAAWADKKAGDEIEAGKVFGVNAFASSKDALTAANAEGGEVTINVTGMGNDNDNNTFFTLTTPGTYTITGGDGASSKLYGISFSEGVNVKFDQAFLASGKLGDGNKGSLTVSNSVIYSDLFATQGGGYYCFKQTPVQISNSIFGMNQVDANLDAQNLPRSAEEVKAAIAKGTYAHPVYGQNHGGAHFGTLDAVDVDDSTMYTGYFSVVDRALMTVDNSVLYYGGTLTVGTGYVAEEHRGNSNYGWDVQDPAATWVESPRESAEGYREGQAAQLDITDSILYNVGHGTGGMGDGGSVVQVGGEANGKEYAGILNITRSEVDLTGNNNTEKMYSILDVRNSGTVNMIDSTLVAEKVINDGAFTVSGASQINIGTLTGDKRIDLAAGAVLTDSNVGGSVNMNGDLTIVDGTDDDTTGLTLTGGLWASNGGTLSGNTLNAYYAMFQKGTYTIDADLELDYGYLSFGGTFTVSSTIHTVGKSGEVLYIRGDVDLVNGGVIRADKGLFLDNSNAVLEVQTGAKVETSDLKLTAAGAELNVAGGEVVASDDITNVGAIEVSGSLTAGKMDMFSSLKLSGLTAGAKRTITVYFMPAGETEGFAREINVAANATSVNVNFTDVVDGSYTLTIIDGTNVFGATTEIVNGTLDVTGGTLKLDALTVNKGAVDVTGESTLNIGKLTGTITVEDATIMDGSVIGNAEAPAGCIYVGGKEVNFGGTVTLNTAVNACFDKELNEGLEATSININEGADITWNTIQYDDGTYSGGFNTDKNDKLKVSGKLTISGGNVYLKAETQVEKGATFIIDDAGFQNTYGQLAVKGAMTITDTDPNADGNGYQNIKLAGNDKEYTTGDLLVDGGTLTINGPSFAFGGGYMSTSWVNAAKATVLVQDGGKITANSTVFRNGVNSTLTLNNGTFEFTAAPDFGTVHSTNGTTIDNYGKIIAENGSTLNFSDRKLENYGTITITDSTFTVGNLENSGEFTMDINSQIVWRESLTVTDNKYITVDLSKYDQDKGAVKLFDFTGDLADAKDAKFYMENIIGEQNWTNSFYVGDGETGELGDLYYNLTRGTYTIDETDGYEAIPDGTELIVVNPGEDVELNHADTNLGLNGITGVVKSGKFEDTVSGGAITETEWNDDWAGATGDTNLTIEDGVFNKHVIGAERVEKGQSYRDGSSNLTIKGGTFNKMVVGGMAYVGDDGNVRDQAALIGDVNLTIEGGTFNNWIYGGSLSKTGYSTRTTIEGDITVKVNASENVITFGENNKGITLVAGSYQHGLVEGSTQVIFTGTSDKLAGLDGADIIWGGSSADVYTTDANGNREFDTMVTGDRTFTFDDFDGEFGALIHGFNTMEVLNGSNVEVTNANLDDIKVWKFDTESKFTGAFGDIAGDTLEIKINGAIEDDWTLGDAGEIEGLFDKVEINGVKADFDGAAAWTTTEYKLAIEGNSLKFSALA